MSASLDRLTPRELQIARMVFDNLTNRAMAMDLGLSHKTIEAHRSTLMRKLRCRGVVELVKLLYPVWGPPAAPVPHDAHASHASHDSHPGGAP